jgi:hypothetical protein
MSKLAWDILEILLRQRHISSYIAAWTLGEKLGGDASTIQAIRTKIHPENDYERALKELLDLGIVKELEDLHERFMLVVK